MVGMVALSPMARCRGENPDFIVLLCIKTLSARRISISVLLALYSSLGRETRFHLGRYST